MWVSNVKNTNRASPLGWWALTGSDRRLLLSMSLFYDLQNFFTSCFLFQFTNYSIIMLKSKQIFSKYATYVLYRILKLWGKSNNFFFFVNKLNFSSINVLCKRSVNLCKARAFSCSISLHFWEICKRLRGKICNYSERYRCLYLFKEI